MPEQRGASLFHGEGPVRVSVEHHIWPLRQHARYRLVVEHRFPDDRFARGKPIELPPEPFNIRAGKRLRAEFTGRGIRPCEGKPVAEGPKGDDVVVGSRFQVLVVDDTARSDHLDDTAVDDALALAGGGQLLAYRDLLAGPEQPPYVTAGGVMGYATHRRFLPVCQRQIEY